MDWILFSGGVDSVLTALELPYANLVHVPTYENFAKVEDTVKYLSFLAKCLKPSGRRVLFTPTLPIDGSINSALPQNKKNYVPYRNLFLVMWLDYNIQKFNRNLKDDAPRIYLGGMADDDVEDKNPSAFASMTNTLNLIGNRDIEVNSLFFDQSKDKALKSAVKKHGMSYMRELMKVSVSCYNVKNYSYEGDVRDNNCGNCPACFRKWVAMEVAGFEDTRHWYKEDIIQSEITKFYLERCNSITEAREKDLDSRFYSSRFYLSGRYEKTLEILQKWGVK